MDARPARLAGGAARRVAAGRGPRARASSRRGASGRTTRCTSRACRSTRSPRAGCARRSAAAASAYRPWRSWRTSSAAAARADSSSRRPRVSTMRTRPRPASTASSTCSRPRSSATRKRRCASGRLPSRSTRRRSAGATGRRRPRRLADVRASLLPLDRDVLVLRARRGARAAGDPVSFGAGPNGLLWRDGDEAVDLSGLGDRLRPADAEPAHGAGPRGVGGGDCRRARARRAARPRGGGRPRGSRSRSRTTSTSTPRSSTRRTSAACSGPTRSRCCRTGAGSRSRTTAAPAASCQRHRRRAPARASGRRPTRTRRRSARAAASTSSSSSASSSASRPELGESVPVEAFADHVFGVVLVNDWSARDIQAWEYVPLGPNLGKSFQTSISAWVTPLALLEDARVEAPPQEPPPLPHLAGGPRLGPRRRARGGAERRVALARQRADALLDAAAAAGSRDVERRAAADRRPDGVGDDLGRGARARKAP